jgi:hypothetical protein
MEVSGQLHVPAASHPGKQPLIPWVEPSAGLDVTEKRKSLTPFHESSVVQSVAYSLYQSLSKYSTKLLSSSYLEYHKGRYYVRDLILDGKITLK